MMLKQWFDKNGNKYENIVMSYREQSIEMVLTYKFFLADGATQIKRIAKTVREANKALKEFNQPKIKQG